MKKGKLLSILTSLAMTGTMIASAMPLTASAASNPLGLKMTSEKTEYTMDEIRAGASATVYVDVDGSVSESDHVGSVEFKLKSSAWGKVDPIDLILSRDNALGTKNGHDLKSDKPINGSGSMVISKWDGEAKPSKAGYAVQDYGTIPTFPGNYNDDYLPAVIMISDSANGFLRTDAGNGAHIAEFKVNFPTDLEAGKYTISFFEARSMICVDGKFGSDASVNVDSPKAQSITFEIGAKGTTGTTEDPNAGGEPKRDYDGDCTITIDKVKADAGETVDVPIYMELGSNVDPKYITGIAFKADYDESNLELVRIYEPEDSAFSDGGFNGNPDTGIFLYNFTTSNITVDPNYPMCVYKFKVKDSAPNGEYKITLSNHLGQNSPLQVIHKQEPLKDPTYLTPNVVAGSITVPKEEQTSIITTEATTPAPVVETVTSIVTSVSVVPVESIVTKESIVTVESIVTKESIVPVESIVTKESIVPVESIVTKESIVPVESIVTKESIVTVESIVTKESIVTVESIVTKESIVEKESIVTVTEISYVPVESISVVTSIDPIKETVISKEIVTVYFTTTAAVTDEPKATSISFQIPGGGNDVEDDDSQWYFADESEWHLQNVKVFVDGEELKDFDIDELMVTYEGAPATPQSVFNGKDDDYVLTIGFREAEATFNAKIGERGDANVDHLTNVRDAAAIAKDLANLYKLKTTGLTKFGLFLGNSDEGKSDKTPAYAPYDFNVRDAAVVAKYLANKKSHPDKILKDYVKIAK